MARNVPPSGDRALEHEMVEYLSGTCWSEAEALAAFDHPTDLDEETYRAAGHQGTVMHSDCIQFYGGAQDVLLEDITATNNINGQGLLIQAGVPMRNFRARRVIFQQKGYPVQNQIRSALIDAVFEDCVFLGTPLRFVLRDPRFAHPFAESDGVVFRNCTFQWISVHPDEQEEFLSIVRFENCFVLNEWPDYIDREGVPYGAIDPEGVEGLELLPPED